MPAALETDFFARLRVQQAAFSAGLPARLAQLAVLHDPARTLPAPAASAALQQQLHTLAGCAATFGYRRLGHEARTLEQRLRVLQAFASVPAHDWQAWFVQLDQLLAWACIDPRAAARASVPAAAPQLT